MRDNIRTVLGYLDRRGIKAELVHGGKHPKLVFEHDGRTWKFPQSLTPSDVNAGKHSVQQIRRKIGEVK